MRKLAYKAAILAGAVSLAMAVLAMAVILGEDIATNLSIWFSSGVIINFLARALLAPYGDKYLRLLRKLVMYRSRGVNAAVAGAGVGLLIALSVYGWWTFVSWAAVPLTAFVVDGSDARLVNREY